VTANANSDDVSADQHDALTRVRSGAARSTIASAGPVARQRERQRIVRRSRHAVLDVAVNESSEIF